MKKILSIFCSLALLFAVGSPAFATDYNTGAINALKEVFAVGNEIYSLPDSAIDQATDYLKDHPVPSAAANRAVLSAINKSITAVRADISQDPAHKDLTKLSPSTKALILGYMTDAAYDDQSFTVGANQVEIHQHGAITAAIDIPTLTVKDNGSSNDNSDRGSNDDSDTASTQTSSQVSVTTGADGKQAVAVTAQPSSAASVANGAASLQAAVPADAVTAVSSSSGASVSVTAPTGAIVSQLNSAAVQNVFLTITAPSGIAYNNVEHAAVSLNVEAGVLEAAKQTKKDVTVGVVDASTGKEVYSWTFKGSDLANSTAALKNVDLALNTATSTLVPAVTSALPASARGVVLTFGNNGALPAPATVKVLVSDQGFKAGGTAYAYYFNAATGKLEQLDAASYTVDAGGYISLTISHTSQYVVLPVQVPSVRAVALDTGAKLTMKAGKTYQFKVTSSSRPAFVCGNSSVFKVAENGSKGNDYFFKVTAIGKAGSSAGFYVNGEKSPRTIGSIA